jgi:hypothetical protein
MWPFRKKKSEESKKKIVRLVKEVELNNDSEFTTYYRTYIVTKGFYSDGSNHEKYIHESCFRGTENESKALAFFDKIVELKGSTNSFEVVKEVEL